MSIYYSLSLLYISWSDYNLNRILRRIYVKFNELVGGFRRLEKTLGNRANYSLNLSFAHS